MSYIKGISVDELALNTFVDFETACKINKSEFLHDFKMENKVSKKLARQMKP